MQVRALRDCGEDGKADLVDTSMGLGVLEMDAPVLEVVSIDGAKAAEVFDLARLPFELRTP
jgi:hypothetical protein